MTDWLDSLLPKLSGRYDYEDVARDFRDFARRTDLKDVEKRDRAVERYTRKYYQNDSEFDPNQLRSTLDRMYENESNEEPSEELTQSYNPVRVYRVENKGGYGPYGVGSDDLYRMEQEQNESDSHPTPEYDEGLEDSYHQHRDHVYGFESLDHLINWFGGWDDALGKTGLGISEYDVHPDHVIKGKHQLMFDPAHAKKVIWHKFSSRLPGSPLPDDVEARERWHRRQIKEKRYPNPRKYVGPNPPGEPESELIRDLGRMPTGTSGPRRILVGGKTYVLKGYSRGSDRPSKREGDPSPSRPYRASRPETDSEYLYHHVAEVFGARHPDVVLSPRSDDRTMDLAYIEGMPAFTPVERLHNGKNYSERQSKLRSTVLAPGGREIGLFLTASGVDDHDNNNWGVLEDGSPITWDHEYSIMEADISERKRKKAIQEKVRRGEPLDVYEDWHLNRMANRPDRMYPVSDFSKAHNLTDQAGYLVDGNDITPDEYNQYRAGLLGLKDKFDKRGRSDWHDELMDRWEEMWGRSKYNRPSVRTSSIHDSMKEQGWEYQRSGDFFKKQIGDKIHLIGQDGDGSWWWNSAPASSPVNEYGEYEQVGSTPLGFSTLRDAVLHAHRGTQIGIKAKPPGLQSMNAYDFDRKEWVYNIDDPDYPYSDMPPSRNSDTAQRMMMLKNDEPYRYDPSLDEEGYMEENPIWEGSYHHKGSEPCYYCDNPEEKHLPGDHKFVGVDLPPGERLAAYDPNRQEWLYDIDRDDYYDRDPAPSRYDNSHQPMLKTKEDILYDRTYPAVEDEEGYLDTHPLFDTPWIHSEDRSPCAECGRSKRKSPVHTNPKNRHYHKFVSGDLPSGERLASVDPEEYGSSCPFCDSWNVRDRIDNEYETNKWCPDCESTWHQEKPEVLGDLVHRPFEYYDQAVIHGDHGKPGLVGGSDTLRRIRDDVLEGPGNIPHPSMQSLNRVAMKPRRPVTPLVPQVQESQAEYQGEPEEQELKPSTYRRDHWNRSRYAEEYDERYPDGEDYSDWEDPENLSEDDKYMEHYGDDNWEEELDENPVRHPGDSDRDHWCYSCGRKNPPGNFSHTNLQTGEECPEGIVSKTRPEESWLRNRYREARREDYQRQGRGWTRRDDMEAADDAWGEVEDHLQAQSHMKSHPNEEAAGDNFYHTWDPMYTYGPNKNQWEEWDPGKTWNHPKAYVGPQTMDSVDHEPGTRMAMGQYGFDDFQDQIGANSDPGLGPDAARGRPHTSEVLRRPMYKEPSLDVLYDTELNPGARDVSGPMFSLKDDQEYGEPISLAPTHPDCETCWSRWGPDEYNGHNEELDTDHEIRPFTGYKGERHYAALNWLPTEGIDEYGLRAFEDTDIQPDGDEAVIFTKQPMIQVKNDIPDSVMTEHHQTHRGVCEECYLTHGEIVSPQEHDSYLRELNNATPHSYKELQGTSERFSALVERPRKPGDSEDLTYFRDTELRPTRRTHTDQAMLDFRRIHYQDLDDSSYYSPGDDMCETCYLTHGQTTAADEHHEDGGISHPFKPFESSPGERYSSTGVVRPFFELIDDHGPGSRLGEGGHSPGSHCETCWLEDEVVVPPEEHGGASHQYRENQMMGGRYSSLESELPNPEDSIKDWKQNQEKSLPRPDLEKGDSERMWGGTTSDRYRQSSRF